MKLGAQPSASGCKEFQKVDRSETVAADKLGRFCSLKAAHLHPQVACLTEGHSPLDSSYVICGLV